MTIFFNNVNLFPKKKICLILFLLGMNECYSTSGEMAEMKIFPHIFLLTP